MAGGDTGSNTAKSEPNVVPLCDILLVLLIIFMVVTPMIQKGANVTLPDAVHTQDQPEPGKMIEVFLKRDGSVIFDEKIIDDIFKLTQLLEEKLEEEKAGESKVLLKADLEVKYESVVAVMDAIRAARIEVIGLVTEKVALDI